MDGALGWALVSLGVAVGVQHLLAHWGLFTVISRGWDDLAVGYPMAGLLAIAGTIVLSRRRDSSIGRGAGSGMITARR